MLQNNLRWILILISTFFLYPLSIQAQNIAPHQHSSSLEQRLDSDFKQLYLVFAGPYPASPSSAFGHLLLLVEPKGSSALNPQLWRAINFSADVTGYSKISTLYNGLRGNLVGSYNHLPFYKKMRDYSYAESRELWLFPVKLTSNEKERFSKFINSREDKSSQYRFADKNCATRISESLHYTLSEPFRNNVFVLPQDVLKNDLISSRLSTPLWVQDIEGQLDEIISKYELNDLSKPDIDSLDANQMVRFLKTYEWLYNNRSGEFDAEKRKFIQQIRYEISQQETDYEFNQLTPKEFDIHHPARVGISYVSGNNIYANKLLVDLRLGLHSFDDVTNTYPQHDYIDLFRIRSMVSRSEVLVDEFWIFNQSSRQPNSKFKNPLSWSLGIGGDRFLYGEQSLMALGIYSAVGRTFSILNNWSSSVMLSVNPTYLEKKTWSLIVNPKIENRLFLSKKFRGLIEFSNPIFMQLNKVLRPKISVKGTYSITNNIYLNTKAEWQSNQLWVLGGINFNISL